MRWLLNMGRLYFWSGVALFLYSTVFASFLQFPLPSMPAFFGFAMLGISVMLMGHSFMQDFYSENHVKGKNRE